MNSRASESETLVLPRPLVNQLLHAAQEARSFSQGFVLRRADDHFRCAPLPADADLARAGKQLQSHAERLFAFYRTSNRLLPPPAATELRVIVEFVPLYLGVALDIRGVLQLRGWRFDGLKTLELDVTIREAET
ncbi:MAG: hypothetical protein WBR15_00450 [Gammaproteobacteria bacterium]